ncbi:hypothetical protein TWF506_009416 [Arthrobotrys conoides]|uniref:Uncharacterized protein n=1 Tax=Arthrobotrys conoides TaxID=74498 RepID=A0AAN8NMJ0_9PEZI
MQVSSGHAAHFSESGSAAQTLAPPAERHNHAQFGVAGQVASAGGGGGADEVGAGTVYMVGVVEHKSLGAVVQGTLHSLLLQQRSSTWAHRGQ